MPWARVAHGVSDLSLSAVDPSREQMPRFIGFDPLQAPPRECPEGLALEYSVRQSWHHPETSGIDTVLSVHTCTQLLGTSTDAQCTCSWLRMWWLSPVARGE